MLKIQFMDRRKPALWLVDSTLTIGSGEDCDIVIDDNMVADRHAELEIAHHDILLRNVSGNRSVFINDVPVVGEHELAAWDVIRLGDCELEIIDPLTQRNPQPDKKPEQATVVRAAVSPWMLKGVSKPLDGQYFSLNNGNVIGRDKSVDIVVPANYVSRRHAKFALRKDKLYIEDLESSNGTFVNGERIQTCEMRNGDEIRLDEFSFTLVGPVTKVDAGPRTMVKRKAPKTQIKRKKTDKGTQRTGLASQKVFLHGLSGDLQGEVFEIVNAQNHVSRMLGHHLSTSETSVSARHVYLNETDLGWEIKNDGAADGLMVNGKMQSRVLLQDGDEVVVGGNRLKFQSVGDKPLNYTNGKEEASSSGTLVWLAIIVAGGLAAAYFAGLI